MRKAPAVTLTALAALALGIGANTAVFTLVDAVLLRPLHFPRPDRIVEVTRNYPDGEAIPAVTPLKFSFWRTQNHSFQFVAAHDYLTTGVNLTGRGEPERVTRLGVSADFFRVLGVAPALGRGFTESEDQPDAGNFVVLSHALWARIFQGDPSVVGKIIMLNSASYVIVGVMPKGFDFALSAELWTPLQLNPDPTNHSNDYSVIARLRDGVTIEQARADMQVVSHGLRSAYSSDPLIVGPNESVGVTDYHQWVTGGIERPLLVLLGAVAFVLLLACANVANLLLARSAAREHEIAVRIALGASGWQIFRQLLLESLLLALTGGAAGVIVAQFALPAILRLTPQGLLLAQDISLDWRILAFAAAVSIATGILFGTLPAWHSSHMGIGARLHAGATRASAGESTTRARNVLVVGEVAISMFLLVGAGLLIGTFAKLSGTSPGFDPHNVLTMQMSLGGEQFRTIAGTTRLISAATKRLESLPGVVGVGAVSSLPLEAGPDLPFDIVGKPVSIDDMPDEQVRMVTPKYFDVMRIPVGAGRAFAENDVLGGPPVLIVNEAFARTYFPKSGGLGQRILIGRIMGKRFADLPREIVGVVGDTHERAGLEAPAPPVMFEPLAQMPDALNAMENQEMPLNWVIRTTEDGGPGVEQIRRETIAATGDVAMAEPGSLEQVVGNSIARQRFSMTLLTILAGIALLLANIGLYGVLSFLVALRTRELAIRSALGADSKTLVRFVTRHGMKLVWFGLTAGLCASLVLTRYLASMLYGLGPWDPTVMFSAAVMLAAVSYMACWLPARRATRIDPMLVLRQE